MKKTTKNTLMHKKEFIDAVAANSDMTKRDAEDAIDAVISTIISTLEKGGGIQLVGFGTFSVVETKARNGINPKTQEKLKIPAGKKPVFKFSGAFKNAFRG